MEVEVGQVLGGKYRVEGELGSGGMGRVLLAYDTALQRRVALKHLLPEYVHHQEACQRFLLEARATVKIKSEHIARVIDVGTLESGAPFMVMEYLAGSNLGEEISRRGQVPVEHAIGYILQAGDAIAEAHSHGIIHRDLKPENLFLADQPDGTRKVKVLDFGISKATHPAGSAQLSLTQTSSVMGSPLYMSPEQMRSSKNVDSRTDIWAMAIILYELIEGRLPFGGVSLPELSASILLDEPAEFTHGDVPPAVREAVRLALDKQSNNRPRTVGEFLAPLAPYAPVRLRNTLERISRLQLTAGLTESPLSFSFAPAEHELRGPRALSQQGQEEKELSIAAVVMVAPEAPHKPSPRVLNTRSILTIATVGFMLAGIAAWSNALPNPSAPAGDQASARRQELPGLTESSVSYAEGPGTVLLPVKDGAGGSAAVPERPSSGTAPALDRSPAPLAAPVLTASSGSQAPPVLPAKKAKKLRRKRSGKAKPTIVTTAKRRKFGGRK